MTKVIKARKTKAQLAQQKAEADLRNEEAKIHNLRSHIRFKLGDMCFRSNCPILANEYSHSCAITTKKIRLYNEVPYEVWKQGQCIERYEKGTWREFLHKGVERTDLEAFIPHLAANLVSSPCPYNVGMENWTKLMWLCQTYNELSQERFDDALVAKLFYGSRVKKMYEVLEYPENACW
jgi:hypothetical protein